MSDRFKNILSDFPKFVKSFLKKFAFCTKEVCFCAKIDTVQVEKEEIFSCAVGSSQKTDSSMSTDTVAFRIMPKGYFCRRAVGHRWHPLSKRVFCGRLIAGQNETRSTTSNPALTVSPENNSLPSVFRTAFPIERRRRTAPRPLITRARGGSFYVSSVRRGTFGKRRFAERAPSAFRVNAPRAMSFCRKTTRKAPSPYHGQSALRRRDRDRRRIRGPSARRGGFPRGTRR